MKQILPKCVVVLTSSPKIPGYSGVQRRHIKALRSEFCVGIVNSYNKVVAGQCATCTDIVSDSLALEEVLIRLNFV